MSSRGRDPSAAVAQSNARPRRRWQSVLPTTGCARAFPPAYCRSGQDCRDAASTVIQCPVQARRGCPSSPVAAPVVCCRRQTGRPPRRLPGSSGSGAAAASLPVAPLQLTVNPLATSRLPAASRAGVQRAAMPGPHPQHAGNTSPLPAADRGPFPGAPTESKPRIQPACERTFELPRSTSRRPPSQWLLPVTCGRRRRIAAHTTPCPWLASTRATAAPRLSN